MYQMHTSFRAPVVEALPCQESFDSHIATFLLEINRIFSLSVLGGGEMVVWHLLSLQSEMFGNSVTHIPRLQEI